MERTVYSEWVPMGALVKGLIVMVTALLFFITGAILFFSGLTLDGYIAVAMNLGVLAFILLLFWNYRGLRIQIGDGKLNVVYGHFNKKSFLLKDIASCKRTTAHFGRYWGIGVRYGSDGSVAYTTSFGDAVEVKPKEGRTFVFSSKRPDQVCQNIEKGIHSEGD